MIAFEAIRNGFNNEEFFSNIYRLFRSKNNCCVGAEALIRWQRPSEVVLPDDFIPLIENTPLSGAVTYWIIDKVAKELGTWLRTNNGVYLAINVPPRS